MKKILCTAVSALALATFADGVNSTEFGALYVPSTTKETIVSVPWLESSTLGTDVSVSNLVLTAGLSTGDTLRLYDGSTGDFTDSWTLTGGKWNAASQNKTTTIPRGSALKLTRTASPITKGFYIMGKPTTGAKSVTLGAGKDVYTLVAPPDVATESSDVNSSSVMTWSGLTKGDMIGIGQSDGSVKFYVWSNAQQKFMKSQTGETTGITIPRGMGAWFISAQDGTKSVEFK